MLGYLEAVVVVVVLVLCSGRLTASAAAVGESQYANTNVFMEEFDDDDDNIIKNTAINTSPEENNIFNNFLQWYYLNSRLSNENSELLSSNSRFLDSRDLIVQNKLYGFVSSPMSRQFWCHLQGDYTYPASTNGSDIRNEMCKLAFEHVEEQGNSGIFQFATYDQYAAMVGSNYFNLKHIKDNVVPDTLCGAGAKGQNAFGDKSGLDLPGDWQRTVLYSNRLDVIFCAYDSVPAFWQLFITNETFDVENDVLTWDDLQLIYDSSSIQQEIGVFPMCSPFFGYRLPDLDLPDRDGPFLLYLRWQRLTPVGESFFNCIDLEYGKTVK